MVGQLKKEDLDMRRFLSRCAVFFALVSVAAMSPRVALGSWVNTGGPVGGIGYDVRINPVDPDTMFVTDNFAGVVKSINAGNSWTPANDGITLKGGPTADIYPIFCLTIDPNNPDHVWAGTFSGNRNFGAFKSTDGGESWTAMNNGISDDGQGLTFRGFTIQPGDSNVVYAQTELPTEITGREFNKVRGRVFRTTNGGLSWSLIWQGDNLARYLIIDPANPNTLYLSTGIFDREAVNSDCNRGVAGAGGVGVLKSADGGASWSPINKGLTDLYVGCLRMHPSNPQVLFAATGNNACSGGYDGQIVSGLFKTDNGGGSWSKVIAGDVMTTVNFSPSNPKIVYAGSARAFYRSADGGTTWTRYSKPSGSEWGPPGIRAGVPIDVTVDPDDSNMLYANNYGGGVFRSTDGAKTWENWSRGYSGAEIHATVIADESGSSVYAIGRSGPYKSTNYGIDWTGIGNGEANFAEWYSIAAMPGNPKVILLADEHQGCILRSMDGGASFTLVFRHPNAGGSNVNNRAGFKALVFAPSNPSVVYACLSKDRLSIFSSVPNVTVFHKSVNGGASFSSPSGRLDGLNTFRLVVDPTNADTVWAATSGGIFKTTDGGKTWNFFSALGDRVIMSLAVDPHDANTIIAGEKEVGIWRSFDGGATWPGGPYNTGLRIASPLITALVYDPDNDGTVYASDFYSGVYRSTDGGNSWSGYPNDAMSGLTVRAVQNLAAANGVLYASTQGSGVFRSGGPSVIPSPSATDFGSTVVGSPSTTQQIMVSNTGAVSRTITNIESTGADAGDFAIHNVDYCKRSLAVSESCVFDVVFTPTTAGLRTASIKIESDDPVMPLYLVSLSGSGGGDSHSLTPNEATIGTESLLTGSGLGSKAGKVTIGGVKFKALSWSDTSIRWLMKKPLAPGIYDVTVTPKEPKGAAPVICSSCFTVEAPEIESVIPDTGPVGTLISLNGNYFGTKKGKVYLVDGSGNQLKCKVISWTMDSVTNVGEIVFSIPKQAVISDYSIAVTNQIGSDMLDKALHVE
jgi:photosystem II stability/assembly factor-like uncharacterized protein